MRISYMQRKRWSGYIFLSPWLIGAVFFLIYPFIFSLILSFSSMNGNNFETMTWVGIENYKNALITDLSFLTLFYEVAVDTLINTPLIVIFSLLIAIVLSREIRGKGFFRSVFFLPVLLGTGFVMDQLLGQNVQADTMQMARGILMPQIVQDYIGPTVSGYIGEFFGRITLVMWGSGVQIIILLNGLQNIPTSLYEVARVDGASAWESFWKITLPMSAAILLLTIIYTIVTSFTKSSGFLDYIISLAFNMDIPKFALSAAMGWIYFVFILLVVLIVFGVMRNSVKRVSE